jgi:hypothetical protein
MNFRNETIERDDQRFIFANTFGVVMGSKALWTREHRMADHQDFETVGEWPNRDGQPRAGIVLKPF